MRHARWIVALMLAAPSAASAPPHSCFLQNPPAPVADSRSGDAGPASSVPEPSTLALVGAGLLGLALSARRSRRPAAD